mmetsp:Transcript_28871/g.61275  ORF Transcript_28871/g.61275 Transcript_28871/m.61275 type:complete len:206 (-) Transcript_28871:30-647(-)
MAVVETSSSDGLLLLRFLGAALFFAELSSSDEPLLLRFLGAAFFFAELSSSEELLLLRFLGAAFFLVELSSSEALLLFRFLGAAFFFGSGSEPSSSSDTDFVFPFSIAALFLGGAFFFFLGAAFFFVAFMVTSSPFAFSAPFNAPGFSGIDSFSDGASSPSSFAASLILRAAATEDARLDRRDIVSSICKATEREGWMSHEFRPG